MLTEPSVYPEGPDRYQCTDSLSRAWPEARSGRSGPEEGGCGAH
jgi:hypothetical protein